MAGPAIDPETGQFLLPGRCPINEYTGLPECPPPTELDCLVVEKVFDQCFKEDIIVRKFPIPTGLGAACENVDLTRVDRVTCQVLSAECVVVDVSPPIDPPEENIRIVTVRQDVEIAITLWDDDPPVPVLLCTFNETITDFFNQVPLFVPPPGVLFGPAGGPFVFCEVVNSTCFCIPETVPPGEPVTQVICTVKICKVIEVTAFIKLLVPVLGFCVPRPCDAAPQQFEIECPPIYELFPPQQDELVNGGVVARKKK
ncbi:MAG: hypothetical protein Q7J85_14045 [Bacillota bacterium]|nr:hypothetical protein [Bacillota bacterium]